MDRVGGSLARPTGEGKERPLYCEDLDVLCPKGKPAEEHLLSGEFLSFRMCLMAESFPTLESFAAHVYTSSGRFRKYGHWKVSVHLVWQFAGKRQPHSAAKSCAAPPQGRVVQGRQEHHVVVVVDFVLRIAAAQPLEAARKEITLEIQSSEAQLKGFRHRQGELLIAISIQGSEVLVVVPLCHWLDAWPEDSISRIAGGPEHGFLEMPLGAVPSGDTVELVLDLVTPVGVGCSS